jgi:hypothetical protein
MAICYTVTKGTVHCRITLELSFPLLTFLCILLFKTACELKGNHTDTIRKLTKSFFYYLTNN